MEVGEGIVVGDGDLLHQLLAVAGQRGRSEVWPNFVKARDAIWRLVDAVAGCGGVARVIDLGFFTAA